jgi:membrane protein
VLPALLVMEEYLETNPRALTAHLVRHFGLSKETAALLGSVLVDDKTHELGSALFAVAGALFFGLGFGRVLQLVNARTWKVDVVRKGSDQGRFALVLLGVYGLVLLLLVQTNKLSGEASWTGSALIPGWIALLVVFFVWAPRLLTHGLIPWHDLLPTAVITAVGLVGIMVLSSYEMERWVDFYARDYGGFGVVMAVFFWVGFSSAVIVWAAALGPALVERGRTRQTAPAASGRSERA